MITATANDDSEALGFIDVDPSYFALNRTQTLNVRDAIAYDLSLLSPTILEFTNWNVQWTATMYTEGFISNTSKLKNALQKYDLGSWSVAYRGQCIDSGFWNFLSQRIQTYVMYANSGEEFYPSPVVPPTRIDNTTIYLLHLFTSAVISIPGSILYVLPTNADIESMHVYISYYATHITGNLPVSFGDL